MKEIAPIRNEADHKSAVAEIRRLWGAEPGTTKGNRLDVLMVLVDDYESKHHAIEPPDPIAAIQIRMEEMALDRADLGRILGVASGRLSEILNRRRRLTIGMMRVLAAKMKLPESCLLQPYEITGGPRTRPRKAQRRGNAV
jgi:HTH-type transcriptional regulator/antitoxin HigA